MTISSSVMRTDPYVCNGITQTFPFDFYVNEATDVRVFYQDTAGLEVGLTYVTDFSVAGIGSQAGGSITTTTVYANGTITIVRGTDWIQETDLQDQGPYFAEVVERIIDRVVMMAQRLRDLYLRTLHLYDSDVDGAGRFNSRLNRIVEMSPGIDGHDAVNLEQMNQAIAAAVAAGGGGGGPGPPPVTVVGNVPSPTAADVGKYLKALAIDLWGWSSLPAVTVASIVDASANAKQIMQTDFAGMRWLLGLNLVNNTSDINKPISTAVSNALSLKLNISSYVAGLGAAVQSQVEAASIWTAAITPGSMVYHPAMPKWAGYNFSFYPYATWNGGYNVASITSWNNGMNCTLGFGHGFSNATWGMIASSAGNTSVVLTNKYPTYCVLSGRLDSTGAQYYGIGPFTAVAYGDFV